MPITKNITSHVLASPNHNIVELVNKNLNFSNYGRCKLKTFTEYKAKILYNEVEQKFGEIKYLRGNLNKFNCSTESSY